MSNKLYDILKWISLVFMPALITLYGVIGNTLNLSNTDTILTIAIAFNTFLGSVLGISNLNYKGDGVIEHKQDDNKSE